jgi:hypothetical protein
MSGQILISYMRDDASYPTGRLYDRLSAHFLQNQIFIDVDNLEPGADFVEAIEASVGSCDAFIAAICEEIAAIHRLTQNNFSIPIISD